MAFVRRPVYGLTFNFQDRDKNPGSVGFYVDGNETIGEIELAINGFYRPNLVALSNAVLSSYSVSTIWEEDALDLAPEEAEVQRKGVFLFRASNGAPFRMSIPSIKGSLVVDRSNIINPAHADVVAFVNNMLSSGPMALVRPRTYLGADLRSFETARKVHRGSNKG